MIGRLVGRRRDALVPVAPVGHYLADFDAPLLGLSPSDTWCLRDAFEGSVIFGGIGSGKTSGSGRNLAHAMLRGGFGGLVLCAKPDERARWERYCADTGRAASLVVFDGSGRRKFNFLEYELARSQACGTFDAMNLVQLFMRLSEAANRDQGGAKTSAENDFWAKSVRLLLKYAIYALNAAYGQVRLPDILRMAQSAPRSEAELRDEGWRSRSFCYTTCHLVRTAPKCPLPEEDRTPVLDYWRNAFANPDQRTPGNVMATLATIVDPFLTGTMRELFCTTTNVVPEMTHEGTILLIDLPVKTYFDAGTLAQHIFKYLWQRATEARHADEGARPVFLWADECQFFINAYDAEFQSTARSSRACTVYLTQNLSGMYHYIGGTHPEHTADSLLGNFQTKIFHANTDHRTNQWAADMIGKEVQFRRNFSLSESDGVSLGETSGWTEGESRSYGESLSRNAGVNEGENRGRSKGRSWGWSSGGGGSSGPGGGSSSSNWSGNRGGNEGTNEGTSRGRSRGWSFGRNTSESSSTGRSGGQSTTRSETVGRTRGVSEVVDYQVQPADFARLRNGGERNGREVDAIVVKGGQVWRHSRSVWLPCVFSQE